MERKRTVIYMWKPDLSPTTTNKGKFGLLGLASAKINCTIEDTLEDDTGKFALITNKGVLVAKRYVWGKLVSCHKQAVWSAFNLNKKLIMYIADVDKFYKFDPTEVIENSQENLKGESVMYNFEIKLGKRWDV